MPYLKLQTNTPVEPGQRQATLQRLSGEVAAALGKPERYVMVTLETNEDMLFAGDDAPMAFIELKSIGLPEAQTGDLSSRITGLVQDQLGIQPDRIYIEFADAPRKMWGWNGGTF